MRLPKTEDAILFAITGGTLIFLAYLATREKHVIDTLPQNYSSQETGISGPAITSPVPEPDEPKAGSSQISEYTSESIPNLTPDFQSINVTPIQKFYREIRVLESHEKPANAITPRGQRSPYGPEPSTFFHSDNFIGAIQ